MNDLEKALKDGLDRLAEENLSRTLEPGAGLDFTSNDYLGLSTAPGFRERISALIENQPLSAPASRLLRGTHPAHLDLEKKLAAGLYTDSAFDTGRVVWLEEYADTELAQPLGMKLFRPIMFPRFAGKESDLETARHTYQEVLPKHFDYLEGVLDGNEFFVGNQYSIADIAIGAQFTQLDLVVGLPNTTRWPGLAKHTQATKRRAGFVENLAACGKMLSRLLPEKVDLS